MSNRIHVVPRSELEAGPPTAGMARSTAFAAENLWIGEARTTAGQVSDWHHHGEHSTYGYVVAGRIRFEFGRGGDQAVEAGPGDFFSVPAHTVHREANPGAEEQVVVVVRVGTGPTVSNVEGPDAE